MYTRGEGQVNVHCMLVCANELHYTPVIQLILFNCTEKWMPLTTIYSEHSYHGNNVLLYLIGYSAVDVLQQYEIEKPIVYIRTIQVWGMVLSLARLDVN